MNALRVIFSGSGEFGLPTLRAIRASGHDIVQIVSQPDRPAGRGRALTPTPIAQFAIENGLPIIRTQDINRETLPTADVMLVIAFGQKIAESVVKHPRLGSINLHASLLPKYRGAAPINWAIIQGDVVTGNSIIRLAPKMDAGAVLDQSELHIKELETAGELHDRLSEAGVPLTLDTIDALAFGNAIETPQDESHATLAPKLRRDSALIDWNRPAVEIGFQIRGMFPWPGCRVRVIAPDGKETDRVTLVRANRAEGAGLHCGEILSNLAVCTRDGAVAVHELLPEGKRAMTLREYRNGHRWEPGMRLESIK